MNKHADRNEISESHSVSHTPAGQRAGRKQALQVENNRPEAVVQNRMQEIANRSAVAQRIPVIQRVANFLALSADAQQDAANAFRMWRGLAGVFMSDAGWAAYDNDSLQAIVNPILEEQGVTVNATNRERLLTAAGFILLPAPVVRPRVNIVWNISRRDQAALQNFPRFLADLQDSRNYAGDGTPGFANAHIDDTGKATWKLQADRELLGGGSVDRLHIDVVVAMNGTVNVTVVAFSENTH